MVQRVILTMLPFFLLIYSGGACHRHHSFLVHLQESRILPWLSLLNIIPLGNLILIYVLAFADWKVMPAPQAMAAQPPYPPAAAACRRRAETEEHGGMR